MQQPNIPTEIIDLPSKGLLYPESNVLSSGKIEMKYMTAKEEDILTNQSYIQKGTVLDELIKSLIVSPGIKYEDLVVGDKNASIQWVDRPGTAVRRNLPLVSLRYNHLL